MKRVLLFFLATVMCIFAVSTVALAERDTSNEEALAQELKELKLFYGVSLTDFDLDREPTRTEAVVMLIRLLGKEEEALGRSWTCHFTDVPGWARNYVGYAYATGLANGVSLTEFGTGKATSAMYITFVLRALGYSDEGGKDFVWDNPYELARAVGILTDDVDVKNFWRADVVTISHRALSTKLKGTDMYLNEKLTNLNVFSFETFVTVYTQWTDAKKVLDAEEVYALCSPGVFYIEVYDKSGKAFATGSGFFIDDKGTAVTNYHVIEGAYSANAQLPGSDTMLKIEGVYDYNKENDWAVIKVNSTGNKYLTLGDASTIVGGGKVYAIGSPEGLQNSISDGIISNPNREIDGVNYIQFSTPISHGSSGGALINKFGEVIGITSATHNEGQNLNFAIPVITFNSYRTDDLTSIASASQENMNYELSSTGVTVKVGESALVSFKCDGIGATFGLKSEDSTIAKVKWETMDDEPMPWNIQIDGVSEGRTTVIVYNDKNAQSVKINVNVIAANQFDTNEIDSYYDYLKYFVQVAGKQVDDDIVWAVDFEGGTFTLGYSIEYDYLYAELESEGDGVYSDTVIALDDFMYGVQLSDDNESLQIIGYLDSDFERGDIPEYLQYLGDERLKKDFIKYSANEICLVLDYLNAFFSAQKEVLGIEITMQDIGFTLYK
ncbi:MAG: serine protease [Ruminococcaceae bacterium]|nr:serine protease [Oscillospiraceae bacterium]